MTIEEYVNKLYKHMGGEVENLDIGVKEDEPRIEVNISIPENEASLFIGSYGDSLEAMETMLRSVFYEEFGGKKIVLDINEYKKRKEEKLRETAVQIAFQVIENEKPYVFGYLNSYERFLIHQAISDNEELNQVESFSEDEDGGRVLVVRMKKTK